MIRKLKSADFSNLVKLFHQLYKIHYEAREDVFNKAQPITETYFKEILYSKYKFCYVYEENNQILGAILYKKIKSEPYVTLKARTIFEIYDIVVDKNHRKQGIGTKLYQFVLNMANAQKIDAVQVEVWAFNTEAIMFYQSIGMNVKKFTFEYLLDKNIEKSTTKQLVQTITNTKI